MRRVKGGWRIVRTGPVFMYCVHVDFFLMSYLFLPEVLFGGPAAKFMEGPLDVSGRIFPRDVAQKLLSHRG